MRISAAQIRTAKGDIASNLAKHLRFVEIAVRQHVDLIVFPELSLTGYEPTLAMELAFNENDQSFQHLQSLSDKNDIYISVGFPSAGSLLPMISLMILRPNSSPRLYSKTFLHPDEEKFFAKGISNFNILAIDDTYVAPAICYEISVPEHSNAAASQGASLYLASVAKSAAGVNQAKKTLTNISSNHGLSIVMSNCVGETADFIAAGQSSVWSKEGKLLGELDNSGEGLIILDLKTMSCSQFYMVG